MTTAARARLRLPGRLGAPLTLALAPALALAALALALALEAGVRHLGAVPDVVRGLVATAILWGAAGFAPARRALPTPLAPFWPLFLLPLGAVVSGLELTVLGFAHVPIAVSTGLVVAAGVAVAVVARGPRERARIDRRCTAFAVVGAVVVALALVPSFRATFATVSGQNPDAHLVTGTAVFLQRAPPRATRPGLPVTSMPIVWRSKYPIFYALASASKLAGLDPIATFPAMAALLVAFVAVGFGLLAVGVFGVPPSVGVLVAALLGLDAATLHLAFHPYWNQLWGLATLPFAIVFAWLAVDRQHAGASALFAGMLLFGAFAYPLMLPYPIVAIVAFAVARRRLPPLPRWVRTRWAVLGALVAVVLAVPLLGVFEKLSTGTSNLLVSNHLWQGDVVRFVALGAFVSTGGGALPFVAVAAFALVALAFAMPRPVAGPLAALLALCALADVRLRLAPTGTYFDFKHMSFVAPLVLALAATGAVWLIGRRRLLPAALGVLAIGAYVGAAAVQTRDELATGQQVTREMLALRSWSRALPHGAAVRLDIPPSGLQLWAAYLLASHPLNSPEPLSDTTYPHVAAGTRAQFSLSLSPRLTAALRRDGLPYVEPRDVARRPLLSNSEFELQRIVHPHGPRTASRARIQPSSIPLT